MTPTGIIVLEGADAAGKTYLAERILERHPDARYIHGTATNDAFKHHLDIAKWAIKLSAEHLVVVDRQWISEHVYGPIMRGRSQHELPGRCFDRLWLKHAAIYVLCAPLNSERQLNQWREDREKGKKEYVDTFVKMQRIVAAYADLRDGQVGHPGNLYVDQLIRYGDFMTRDDTLFYDMYTDGTNERALSRFIGCLINKLEAWRGAQFQPALVPNKTNLTGHVANATHLIIGEELSPRAPGPWPFFWSDQMSAATWLNRALHEIGVDETKLLFTNATMNGHRQQFGKIVEACQNLKGIIALGRVAMEACSRQNLICTRLDHPQFVRRFRAKEFDVYVEELKEALS